MPRLLLFASLLCGVAIASADPDIQSKKLYPGSESPDGIGLYCINGGLKDAAMVLMRRDEDEVLATIPVPNSMFIGPRSPYLAVVWNDVGSVVAFHNRVAKRSRVVVFRRVEDGTFQLVSLPDLLRVNAKTLADDISRIISYGEEPVRWSSETMLTLELRYRTKKGGHLNTKEVSIDIGEHLDPEPAQVEQGGGPDA